MAVSPQSDGESRPDSSIRRWLRRAAANLALALAGVVIAFIIGEIGVRALGLSAPNFYTYDAYRGWAMSADARGWQRQEGNAFIAINRDGFRGPDYPYAKPDNVLRIAVLGDSFTEAQQVAYDDTFCAVIQRELSALCPLKTVDSSGRTHTYDQVEVLDFGCDGYGTAQELITLRRQVWKYSPDIVVLAVFTGNDIRNNSVVLEGDKCRPFYVYRTSEAAPRGAASGRVREPSQKLELGGPFDDSWRFRMGCLVRFESRHSQLLNRLGDARSFIRARVRAHFARRTVRKKPAGTEVGLNNLIYRPPASPVWVDAWRVTDGEIAMVSADVKRHRAAFLAVTLANGIQDDPNPVKRARFMRWLGITSLSYPDDQIKDLGERDGFAVLNLAPPMQAYAQAHHQYLHGFANTRPGIGHWNAVGHRVAGKLIAAKLARML
ncbi:MAG: SGNH/GDSL hydrolase family protein, partial [Candidatus Binataceae bacterium]